MGFFKNLWNSITGRNNAPGTPPGYQQEEEVEETDVQQENLPESPGTIPDEDINYDIFSDVVYISSTNNKILPRWQIGTIGGPDLDIGDFRALVRAAPDWTAYTVIVHGVRYENYHGNPDKTPEWLSFRFDADFLESEVFSDNNDFAVEALDKLLKDPVEWWDEIDVLQILDREPDPL
jgi:hypothetical protein